MATGKVINIPAAVLLLLLLYLCAINELSVTALAIENPNESQTQTTDSEQTSYNASEPVVPAIQINDTSQKESSKVIIDFNLSNAQQSHQNDERKKDDDGTTPILKLIIDQSDGISVNATSEKMATTETSDTSHQSADAETDIESDAKPSDQHLLIPPATVNANIAQMPNSSGPHKQQGQIIIR